MDVSLPLSPKHDSQVVVRFIVSILRVSFSVLGDLQTYIFWKRWHVLIAKPNVSVCP